MMDVYSATEKKRTDSFDGPPAAGDASPVPTAAATLRDPVAMEMCLDSVESVVVVLDVADVGVGCMVHGDGMVSDAVGWPP
jgi:DNA-directed RNA polymerase subunit E'/Rpb7